MKKFVLHSLMFCLILLSAVPQADACTTFSMDGHVGKSYDWDDENAVLLHNKAGIAKKSLLVKPSDVKEKWTSQYSSVTYNQYGQEFPLGGMNDQGLVVEIMVLGRTQFPAADHRPSLNELQWIQYQLDNFSKTKDVVASESKRRISSVQGAVHYLVCDRDNDCAAFEYIDGKPVIAHKDTMPHAALTNDTYEDSLKRLRHYAGFGGTKLVPQQTSDSLGRFVLAVARAKEFYKDPVVKAFDVLSRVRIANYTKFNLVYDQENLVVYVRTAINAKLRSIPLKLLTADCHLKKEAEFIDIHHGEGDLSKRLKDFTSSDNAALVKKTAGNAGVSGPIVEKFYSYPATTVCE